MSDWSQCNCKHQFIFGLCLVFTFTECSSSEIWSSKQISQESGSDPKVQMCSENLPSDYILNEKLFWLYGFYQKKLLIWGGNGYRVYFSQIRVMLDSILTEERGHASFFLTLLNFHLKEYEWFLRSVSVYAGFDCSFHIFTLYIS